MCGTSPALRTLLIVLIVLFTVDSVNACKCLPLTFEDEVKISNNIFHGRVISADRYKFDVEIIQIWKGDSKLKVFHLTQGTTSCERRTFELNKEYLFYLRDSSVFNCSRTSEFNLTTDTELLDSKFNNVGSKEIIESKILTDRQLSMLKNILTKENVKYPVNFEEIKIKYAYETSYIDKIDFFESVRRFPKVKLIKVTDKKNSDTETYILWSGYNWDKSFKKLKKKI